MLLWKAFESPHLLEKQAFRDCLLHSQSRRFTVTPAIRTIHLNLEKSSYQGRPSSMAQYLNLQLVESWHTAYDNPLYSKHIYTIMHLFYQLQNCHALI